MARTVAGEAWFACRDCGAVGGPLIGGSCERCEPEPHRLLRQARAAFEWHSRAYTLATGRPAAEDWAAFEHWRHAVLRRRRV